ncbi:hypothetical protein [Bacillus sp. COPE52]|uniref:hypothetical protein n=1 Tax=Bacillus sp. COPE52 TaxID=2233998 RepID=UPI001ABF6463|nr:hypothetical protein [Bacillus sp. COPE52]
MSKNMQEAIFFLLLTLVLRHMDSVWLCVPPMIMATIFYSKHVLDDIDLKRQNKNEE